MKYFAGLDVSLEGTAICVVDERGEIVKERRSESEPEALISALSSMKLGFDRIGLEACSLTAWLHEGLKAARLPAICIESRHAKVAMGAMPNKTDRNDARAIAQIMRTGWFREVHVKDPQCRAWRSLLVARRTVLNEMRTIENVVRARRYQSGEPDVRGRVNRCGDELARTALYEAAHSLLTRSKKWPSLRRVGGMKIAKRRGMAKARVAVARKLATILHRVWVEATAFRFGHEPTPVPAATSA